MPYDASGEEAPCVENMNFSKVRVFDETYVNSYLFKEKSFLENSFNVFLKSTECDKLTADIIGLLADLQGIFQNTDTIQELKDFLPQYCDAIIYKLRTEHLYTLIELTDKYVNIIVVRLLFERYPGLLSKLRKEFPAACKFINETNHIENDYIFQLDPFKFFSVPSFYLQELIIFLSNYKEEIESELYFVDGAEEQVVGE